MNIKQIDKLTAHERAGLYNHHLSTDKPSQLSDAFLAGMKWQAKALIGDSEPVAWAGEDNIGLHSYKQLSVKFTVQTKQDKSFTIPLFTKPPSNKDEQEPVYENLYIIGKAKLALKDAECEKLKVIKECAENLVKVKGRHNSEIAMNRLIEALKGELV